MALVDCHIAVRELAKTLGEDGGLLAGFGAIAAYGQRHIQATTRQVNKKVGTSPRLFKLEKADFIL